MYRVAVWCSVSQYGATWCSALQRVAACCSVLQCVAASSSTNHSNYSYTYICDARVMAMLAVAGSLQGGEDS